MLKRLRNNWPIKFLALTLAFGIWVTVTSDNVIVQDFNAPVDIQLPSMATLTTDPPTKAVVRLRGPESSIRRVDPVELAVRVRFSEGQLGRRDVVLTETHVSGIPRGVSLDFISPDRLNLNLERSRQRELPVEPAFVGKPPEGFAYYGALVTPASLRVEGPASEVSVLERLRTNPIRLDDLTQPTDIRVVSVPDSPHVRIVDDQPLAVRVMVDATAVERKFEGVRVETEGGSFETAINPSMVDVVLTGPPSVLSRLRPDSLRVVVDVGELKPGDEVYRLPISWDYESVDEADRAWIKLESMSRRKVDVRILGGSEA